MNKNKVAHELPLGWTWTTIGEIGIVTSGGTPSTRNPKYWGNDIAWITPADLSNYNKKYISKGKRSLTQDGLNYSSAKLLPPKSILFSSRAPIGYVVIANNDLATNQGFKNIIPTKSLFSDYVYYYLKTVKSLAEKMASGTTFLELSATQFSQIPIPLPPLNEQHRIVSKIEELFSKLEHAEEDLKKAQKRIEIYRHALLKSAFEGKLTDKWRKENNPKSAEETLELIYNKLEELYQIQFKEYKENSSNNKSKMTVKPKILSIIKNEIKNIPKLWINVALGNITTVVRGASPRPAGDSRYFGGNVPWITVGEITKDDNKTLTKVTNHVTELGKEKSRFIKKGTLLLTNSGATLGVPKITMLDGCINDGSVAFFNIINDTLSNYLYWFLKSQTGLLRKISQGAGQPNLNTQIVKNILIPLPTFEEQVQIVNKIESSFALIENLEKSINAGLKKAYSFKQTILKKAFEGKLVSQIANDASATELLKRIRTEKDAYWDARIEIVKKKPKRERTMENNKSILEILKETNVPIDAKDLWQQSKHKDDIEAFYAELKKLLDKINITTKGKKSLIELENENR